MHKQLIGFAFGLLSLLTMTMRADAHAFMVHAEPRVGSKVKKAPNKVQIWFSEPVQPASSTIKVFDVHGKQVDKKDTHLGRTNRALLHVSLIPGLAPGFYRVIWRATSVDTHMTNGDFRFQIAL
jgi:copper resistance protein C